MTIRGRWAVALLAALAVSVALNLFAAGAAVSLLRLRDSASGLDRGLADLRARFPPEIRRALRRELFAERGELRRALARLSAARAGLFEAARADPLDPAELEARMAEVRRRTTELQALVQAAALDALSAADPEARAGIEVPDRPEVAPAPGE